MRWLRPAAETNLTLLLSLKGSSLLTSIEIYICRRNPLPSTTYLDDQSRTNDAELKAANAFYSHTYLHTHLWIITSIEDTASVLLVDSSSHQSHSFHFLARKALISLINFTRHQRAVNAFIDIHLYPQCYLIVLLPSAAARRTQ